MMDYKDLLKQGSMSTHYICNGNFVYSEIDTFQLYIILYYILIYETKISELCIYL